MEDIIQIEVGRPGPAGSGVTAGDWNIIRSDVNNLQDPTTNPQPGLARRGGFNLAFTSDYYLSDTTISWTVDPTKACFVTIWGECDVQPASGKTASIRVTINSGTWNGNTDTSGTSGINYFATSTRGITIPKSLGLSSITAALVLRTSDATVAAWTNFRVWGQVIQLG